MKVDRLKMGLAALVLGCANVAIAQQGSDCGNLANHYGPLDYRTTHGHAKFRVESVHFTPEVENLIRGRTSYLAADIDYTLRAFPNHHRALLAMMNYSLKIGLDKPQGARYRVECYFDRAIRFRPDDGAAHMLYGFFLLKKGRDAEAIEQLNKAHDLSGEDANINYNLGLAYFKLKEFGRALEYAHKAYAGGFPLPGLRNLLEKADAWRDPASNPP